MSRTACAIRVGMSRGWTEFRRTLTSTDGYAFNALVAVVVLAVLYLLRHHTIAHTDLSLATVAVPGVVGMLVAFNTTLNAAFLVATEREDGTLLRLRMAPFGMVGYVAGQAVRVPLMTVLGVLFVIVPGFVLFPGLVGTSLTGWLTFVWVFALGVLATLPFGLAIGALAKDPRSPAQGFGLLSMVLIAISGIFYPISSIPGWLHPVAQVFPYYWLGTGMRSALLPHVALAAEPSGSWQHVRTLVVLAIWAVAGLSFAAVTLRTVARRESGSAVIAGRRKAAQRKG